MCWRNYSKEKRSSAKWDSTQRTEGQRATEGVGGENHFMTKQQKSKKNNIMNEWMASFPLTTGREGEKTKEPKKKRKNKKNGVINIRLVSPVTFSTYAVFM